MTTSNASRRLFLRQAAALSSLGAAAPFALNLAAVGAASAQSAGDYKALVCIFLHGGNDSFNTVLPTDTHTWNIYRTVRNQLPESIALLRDVAAVPTAAAGSPEWLGGVLPLSPAESMSRTFALHPMLRNAQTLFNTDRRLSIVANVGPLIEPLTKAEYRARSRRIPTKLFSHNDQQNTWQAFAPEGATVGWGGRLADMIAGGNNGSMFTAVSASGNSVWLSGETIRQYQVSAAGATRLGTTLDGSGRSTAYNLTQVGAALERMARQSQSQHVFSRDIASVNGRAIDGERVLTGALMAHPRENAPFGPASLLNYNSVIRGTATTNPLAEQLQIVARMIAARSTLGLRRQVFFVNLGGFDTHDKQNLNHADLMARLDHGLGYFNTVLQSLGVADAVTTFTASDFGRTFTSNGDGTDHGWGAHHFVMGGAVRGGHIVGTFPTLGAKNSNNNEFDSSPDQLANGSLLPTTSVDQLGAALASWLGVATNTGIFPNISNFSTPLPLML